MPDPQTIPVTASDAQAALDRVQQYAERWLWVVDGHDDKPVEHDDRIRFDTRRQMAREIMREIRG